MQQKEKNELSREKILSAAIAEFGKKGYDGGSVNDMCAENKISKGLIYHYFGSKEALFCACLRRCFGKMEACLRAALPEDQGLKAGLRAFTGARRAFFDENAPERALFFQTLLNPPKALYDKVKEAKRSLDDFTVQYFGRLLQNARLRKGVTGEDALGYLVSFEEMFHLSMRQKEEEPENVAGKHEELLEKWLEILFYGVIEKEQ